MSARKARRHIDPGITSIDELFMSEAEREENRLPKIYDLYLEDIDDFPDHPFGVRDDEDMQELVESIREYGVITPALVRETENDRYELISGHRRKHACELLGMKTMRCEIVEMSRDEAIIAMIDSNLQRTSILPSEKAKAYKMRLEAMKRQGKRTDLTSVPLGQKLAREELANQTGDSQTQIQRYIRLNNLIPELLELVDEGRMKMRQAVELSYVDEDTQRDIVDRIDETDVIPSHEQAIRIRKAYEDDDISYDKVSAIMAEEKPNQKPKYKLSFEKLRPFIPKGYTDAQAEDYIMKALEHYRRFLQREQAER